MGVLLLLRPRQAPEARWIGAFLALTFANLILGNVVGMIEPPSAQLDQFADGVEAIFNVLAAGALATFLLAQARDGHASARRAFALALGCAVAMIALALVLASLNEGVSGVLAPDRLRNLSLFPMFAFMGATGWHVTERAHASASPTRWIYLAAIACYPIAFANEVYIFAPNIPSPTPLALALLTALPVLVTIVALSRARSTQGRAAWLLGSFC